MCEIVIKVGGQGRHYSLPESHHSSCVPDLSLLAGPLLQQPAEDVLTEYKTYVFSHYLLAKYLLPLLRPARESSFTFVTGSAGEAAHECPCCSGMVTGHDHAENETSTWFPSYQAQSCLL